MLIGADISHHNQNMKDKVDLNKLDFVLMKASEGVKFRDPALPLYVNSLSEDKLRGFYHYCRSDERSRRRSFPFS